MAVGSYFVLTFVLAGVLIVAYLVSAAFSSGKRPKQRQAINLFFAAIGIALGIRLVIVIFTEEDIGTLMEGDRYYIAVAVLVVWWNATSTILRAFDDILEISKEKKNDTDPS